MNTADFLNYFKLPNNSFIVSKGNPSKGDFHLATKANIPDPTDREFFFTPARTTSVKNEKAGIIGTAVLWVDWDDPEYPKTFLPPSLVVFSGHGWHLYYKLSEPLYDIEIIETYNKLLAAHYEADDCWNVNRFLRVPNTLNRKREPYPRVEVKAQNPFTYALQDFDVLRTVTAKTIKKVLTGDSRGYKSRSERDFAVIAQLIQSGASDNLIQNLFNFHRIGDKADEAHETYLPRTIAKVRATAGDRRTERGIVERDEGYFLVGAKSEAQISTFTFEPSVLLDGSHLKIPDALVGTVRANGREWENVVFSRNAFTSVKNLDSECRNANWQWLGNEGQLRKLLPYLIEKLTENEGDETVAVPTTGFFEYKGVPYFIGTDRILTPEHAYEQYAGTVSWIPTNLDCRKTNLRLNLTNDQKRLVGEFLPKLNKPEVIWLMVGWYTSALLKPFFEKRNRRFPILTVTGAKGSGKTTLIKQVFMPLFGQKQPKTTDAGTTRFVILNLLGSSVSLPIAFSEFRYESVATFLRYVLLSYDNGVDPRGRANQTVVNYPLIAPFSLDGEDDIADPAARERIVTAKLKSLTVEEGSVYFESFKTFQEILPINFAGKLIQYLLKGVQTEQINKTIAEAESDLFGAFPERLPDRVRNNHTVVLTGAYLFADFCGIERPNAEVVATSIHALFNVKAQRSRLLVDDFVEDTVNAVATHTARFKYHTDHSLFSFQMSTAHPAWALNQKRRGATALERDAILAQLEEVEYYEDVAVIDNTLMYQIDLQKAFDAGLDLPNAISPEMTLHF